MRHVYLSPHLDDAVLSCGGAIHRHTASGEPVLAITIFAGEFKGDALSPFALLQHQHWGNSPRPMTLRRAEDVAALALLDASGRHLDYLDAVYRAGPDGEWLYAQEDTLWRGVHPGDPMAQNGSSALAGELAGLIPPQHQTMLYAPLGVGNHIDHQIVHAAARKLLKMGYQVAFYEDCPYAEKPGALESALVTGNWRMEAIPLSEEDLAVKVSALGYYRSQMSVLFGGVEAMPNRVWAFAVSRSPQRCLEERIWWLAEE